MSFMTLPPSMVRFRVLIDTSPASETSVYAIEEIVPAGLTLHPESISDSGAWDAISRKVRWGPFFDEASRTLSYEVTVPAGASAPKLFQGIYSADGADTLITGDRLMASGPPLEAYSEWRQRAFENPDSEGSGKDGTNRTGTSHLLSYALGWSRSEDGPLPRVETEVVDELGTETMCFVFQKSKTAMNLVYTIEVSDSLREPPIIYSIDEANLVGETEHAWIFKLALESPSEPKQRRFAWLRVKESQE